MLRVRDRRCAVLFSMQAGASVGEPGEVLPRIVPGFRPDHRGWAHWPERTRSQTSELIAAVAPWYLREPPPRLLDALARIPTAFWEEGMAQSSARPQR